MTVPPVDRFAAVLDLADALGHALVVVGHTGHVVFANHEARRRELAGMTEWTERDWFRMWGRLVDARREPIRHADWPLVRCLRHGVASERVPVGFLRNDGALWFNVTCIPFADHDRPGRRGAVLMMEDVTRLHEQQQQLRRARALLASAFDASPLPMAVSNQLGALSNANAAFERFATPETLRGSRPWWSFVDRESRDDLFAALRAVDADPDAVFEVECRGTTVEGEPVLVRVFGAPIRDTDDPGGPIQLSVQLTDITELRRSESRHRSLVETVPVGIFEMDRRGCFADLTPLMVRMIAEPDSSLIGRAAVDFVQDSDQDRVRRHFARALAGRASTSEFRIVHEDGRHRLVLASFQPVFDVDGQVTTVTGGVLDLSENAELQQRLADLGADMAALAAEQARARLEAELAQARRFETVGRLASGVAHDFNNLLGVIANYAGLLTRRADLPDDLRRDVEQIAAAADRGADLTRQLLLYSRREQLRPQRFDLGRTLEELAALMVRPLQPNVQLLADVQRELWVQADPGQIEQMVLNLLLNARDALPDGGHIELRACAVAFDEAGTLGAMIEVTDDGVGIAEEHLPEIFEPFFTTKARSEASGLGLATVLGIVEQARGTIEVTSRLGTGTTVTIRLPQA